jgi:hypothetical protein
MAAKRKTAPPTAEEVERVNRQPDVKGRPAERGSPPKSAEPPRKDPIRPKDRRDPSGLLDVQHPPGSKDRPERKP